MDPTELFDYVKDDRKSPNLPNVIVEECGDEPEDEVIVSDAQRLLVKRALNYDREVQSDNRRAITDAVSLNSVPSMFSLETLHSQSESKTIHDPEVCKCSN